MPVSRETLAVDDGQSVVLDQLPEMRTRRPNDALQRGTTGGQKNRSFLVFQSAPGRGKITVSPRPNGAPQRCVWNERRFCHQQSQATPILMPSCKKTPQPVAPLF
jgi:hypothetical protein